MTYADEFVGKGNAVHASADVTALAQALNRLGRRSGLLLPLADAGCDGDCHTPAFYDRATNVWRHLNTLSQCPTPERPDRTDQPLSDRDRNRHEYLEHETNSDQIH